MTKVKIGVALQLKSKTGILAVVIGVVAVVVLDVRIVAGAGAGEAFTGVFVLLLFVLGAAGVRGGAGTVARL